MIGFDVVATNHERPAGVAERLQRREDGVSAPSSEISAVLKSEPTRSDLSDDADGFEEEARTLAFDAFAFGVGAGDVLAGGASDDDTRKRSKVCKQACRCERADIVIDRNSRVILGIEGAPPCDRFACSDGLEASSVHTERPTPSRSAEKVENAHQTPAFSQAMPNDGQTMGSPLSVTP